MGRSSVARLLSYAECATRMIWEGVRIKPELIHANDLSALPIAHMIAKLTGARLVYDSHELWSDPEYPSYQSFPHWLFRLATGIERFIARRADAVITVSDGIANRMAEQMLIPTPTVVRNLPNRLEWDAGLQPSRLHEALGLDPETPIILHLGALCDDRGIETLMSALPLVPEPGVAVFLGSPEYPSYLKALHQKAQELGIEKRVFFLPPVSSSDVCSYASGAAVGVSLLRNNRLNNKLALPNKLFEYLQAGLPVIVNGSSEKERLVKAYQVGETFPDGDSKALANALNIILNDASKREYYREMALKAARELNWQHEELRLQQIYERLLPSNRLVVELQ